MEILLQYIRVFITGGALCMIAQVLIDKTRITPARILVSYVISGIALHAFGVFDRIVQFGSMGAKVPLIGFGRCLAVGVERAVDESGLLGALSGGLTGASAGISAAILFAYLASLFFKSKDT
ncbi:MAG: SpoVA/SpoVAEb family sporulation membrane protein [Clostridia bacterium]|nr:SpoVA/SpoVAEb family sporulation membrane protein [Clostridia bacterium]